jgi:hypothetical protein
MGSLAVLLLAEQKKRWSLMTFNARATRGRGLSSLDARARIDLATPENEMGN